MPTLTEVLASFVTDTNYGDIPSRVIDRAKVSLVHNIAVALAGRERGRVAHDVATCLYSTASEATMLATGRRSSVEGAAFANGSLFHARSQDDTHPASTSHPGAPTMAAAFAAAEKHARSGSEFLAAVALGYEVLCRVGRDFDHLLTQRGFRAACVFGGFGAVAAAAKLMRLSAAQTGHALGFAAHSAGGLAQVWLEGSPEFPMQLGLAARHGVFAACAARAGMQAGRMLLEGKSGLYRAYAGTDTAPGEILHGLGETWQLEEVTVKPFPACAILQGPLELALRLADQHEIEPGRIETVRLELNPYEANYPGIDNPGPRFASPAATKMSAQFCLAVALQDRRLTLDDLARLDDPAIAALAAKVSIRRNETIPERLCRLTIDTSDGRTESGTIDAPVGRPDFAAISAFATRLAPEMRLPGKAVDRILCEIAVLEHAPSLAPLISAICEAPQPEAITKPRGSGIRR